MGTAFITRRGGNVNIENPYDLIPINSAPALGTYTREDGYQYYTFTIPSEIFIGEGTYNFTFIYNNLTIHINFVYDDINGIFHVDPGFITYGFDFSQFGGGSNDNCTFGVDFDLAESIGIQTSTFIKGFAYYTPFA